MISDPAKKWLDDVYDSRRKRTVEITQKSIELLLELNEKVSLSNITKISREIDLNGISHSAILNNNEARKIYEANRTWIKRKRGNGNKNNNLDKENLYNLRINSDLDLNSFIRNHSKWTKIQLIERLAVVEKAYALLHLKWIEQQSAILEDL